MKQKGSFRLGIGTISIFMVFIVLCFTILSCIAYMKASDDDERSKQQLDYIQAYYQADGKARKIQASLIAQLSNLDTDADQAFLSEAKVIRTGNEFYYEVAIRAQQKIAVTLRLEADTIKVVSWKTISSEEEAE